MAKRQKILGLDVDLLTLVAIFFAAVAAMWLLVGCSLLQTGKTDEAAGGFLEQLTETVAEIGGSINYLLLLAGGYLMGELRRPGMGLAKKGMKRFKDGRAIKKAAAIVAADLDDKLRSGE